MTSVPDFLLSDGDMPPGQSSGQSSTGRPGFFDMVLPPQAMVLVLLLLLTAPLVLLTGESLLAPFIGWIKSLFTAETTTGVVDTLPSYFFIKFAIFLVLVFLGGVQLLLRLNTIYYGTWSSALPQPHALHPPYQPEPQLSSLALLNWSLYRLLHIAGLPLLMFALMFGLGFLELYLFNLLSFIPVFSLPIQVILATFLFLLMGVVTVAICLRSVWVLLSTLFGDVIAVTEPDLPVHTILERCQRIALVSPRVIILYPAYVLFYLGLIGALAWLVFTYDIEDIIHLKANFFELFMVESLLLGVYLILNYWNLSSYHHALMAYYYRLPAAIKDKFVRQS
jgi:hypothetical protein